MKKLSSKLRRVTALIAALIMVISLVPNGFAYVKGNDNQSGVPGFIQEVRFVSEAAVKANGENPDPNSFGDNVARDVEGTLWFHYKPTETSKPVAGNTYTFNVEGYIVAGSTANFTVTTNEGKNEVAKGTIASRSDGGDGVTVTLTYNSDEVTKKYLEESADGYFWGDAKLNKDKISNDGQQDIEIKYGDKSQKLTMNFAMDPVETTLEVKKSAGDIDTTKRQIDWTISAAVTSKNLPTDTDATHQQTDLVITDTIQKNQSFVSVVETTGNNTTTLTSGTDYTVSDNVVTITKKKVALSDTKQTFTYKLVTSYAEDYLSTITGSTATFENTAKGAVNGPKYELDSTTHKPKYTEATLIEDTDTGKKELKTASITKTSISSTNNGKTDADLLAKEQAGYVKWQINVNSMFGNEYIKDTIKAGHVLAASTDYPITIKNGSSEAKTITSVTEITSTDVEESKKTASDVAVTATKGDETGKENQTVFFYLGNYTGETTITYYTKLAQKALGADDSASTTTLTNDAQFYAGKIGPVYANSSRTVDNTFITKTAVQTDNEKGTMGYDASTQTQPWQITVNNNNYFNADGFKLEDIFDTDANSGCALMELMNSTDYPFTVTVYSSSDTTGTTYTAATENNNGYAIKKDAKTIGTLTVKEGYAGYDIAFDMNTLGSFTKIVVSYTTKFVNNSNDAGNSTQVGKWLNKGGGMKNTTKVTDGTHRAQTEANAWNETKVLSKTTDGNPSYDYTTQTASYKITVNEAKMALTNAKVTDTLDKAVWSYDSDSVKIYKASVSTDDTNPVYDNSKANDNSSSGFKVEFKNNEDTNTKENASMEVTLPSMKAGDEGATYIIVYNVKLNDDTALATSSEYKLNNTAALTADEIPSDLGITSTATSNISGKQLVKSSSLQEGSRIATWTIDVNKNLGSIPATDKSGHVVVTDPLADGLSYVDGTAKVTALTIDKWGNATVASDATNIAKTSGDATEGAPIVSYDEETNTLKVTFVKDDLVKKAYRITFDTIVSETGKSYSNTAYFGDSTDTQEKSEQSWSSQSNFGGGFTRLAGANIGSLIVKKVDTEGNYIEGATFKLEKLKSSVTVDDTTKVATDDLYWKENGFVKCNSIKTSKSGILMTEGTKGQSDYKELGEGNIVLDGLSYGTYRLTETEVATVEGKTYQLDATPYVFTLSDDNQIEVAGRDTNDAGDKVWINYEEGEIAPTTFSKTDAAGTAELEGATITITTNDSTADLSTVTDINDNTTFKAAKDSVTWTSANTAVKLKGLTANADGDSYYTMTETTAPAGYAKAETIYFKLNNSGQALLGTKNATTGEITFATEGSSTVTMKDAAIKGISIDKVAIATSGDNKGKAEELVGASMELYKADNEGKATGDAIESWTSEKEKHTIEGSKLEAGTTYVLHESASPDGYAVASDITFTIADDGSVTGVSTNAYAGDTDDYATDADERYIVMLDDVSTANLVITKTIKGDVTREEAEGALKFHVTRTKNDGTKDDTTTYTLKDFKYDSTTKAWTKELPGYAGTYTVEEIAESIDGFVLSTASYKVTGGIGTAATEGKAEATAEAEATGVTASTTIAEKGTATIAFENDYTTIERDVEISKVDATNSKEIHGATIQITTKDDPDTVIEEWVSGKTEDEDGNLVDDLDEDGNAKTHYVKLPYGTYILTEITAPDGYDVAESIEFTVAKDGTVTSTTDDAVSNTAEEGEDAAYKVTMKDAPHGFIVITKTIEGDVTKEEAEGAITFIVEDLTKETKEAYKLKDFDYDENTKTYTKTLEKSQGGYRISEEVTNIIGMTLAAVTYDINGAGAVAGASCDISLEAGKTVEAAYKNSYDPSDYIVTISKVDAANSEEIAGAKLVIVNKATGLTVAEWVSGSDGKDANGKLVAHNVTLAAGNYTLTEITAPEGYAVAESIDFAVGKDGKVTGSDAGIDTDSSKVTMKDAHVKTVASPKTFDMTTTALFASFILTMLIAVGALLFAKKFAR